MTHNNTVIAEGGVDLTYCQVGVGGTAMLSTSGLVKGTDVLISPTGGMNPAILDGFVLAQSFHKLNVTTNLSGVVVPISGGNSTNSDFLVPRAGSLLGIAVYLNGTMTSGTLNVWPTINGTTVPTGKVAMTKAAGSNKTKAVALVKDAIALAAFDLLGVKITSGTTFAPVTADLNATVYLEI
jgi:hypothetical protein